MPQVRCLQCGAVNDTNALDYPFCVGCQDNLAKCGYCRWFDQAEGLCLNSSVAGMFDPAPDATPPCHQHSPADSVVERTRSSLPFAVSGALVALLVLVYAVLVLREPAPLPPMPPADYYLGLAVESGYREAVIGKPFSVTVDLQNPADRLVSGIRLQISKNSLCWFSLHAVVPRADAREDAGEWMALIYPALRPRETKRIDLELLPKKIGLHHLEVRLVSGGKRYHGLVDLPIHVKGQSSQEEA